LSAQLHPVRLMGPDDDDNSDIQWVFTLNLIPLLMT